MRTIAVDFESFYEASKEDGSCSIKTLGGRKYCMDPRTDPYLISVSDGAETWSGHPRDFNFDALDGQDLLSHNAGFDLLMAKEKIKSGAMPKFRPNSWHCTANLSVYLSMRRDLLRAAEFLLGVTVDKSYRLDADGKTGEQLMADPAVWQKVLAAGRSDALTCHNLWTKYSHLWPEHERRLSELTIRQGHRGVQIDVDLLKKFLHAGQSMAINAEQNLPWIAEGGKPRSTKALAEYCRKAGIPMAPVKKWAGEDAYDEWANTYGPKYPWVKAFSDYATINKFIKNCETFKERLDAENVLSFDLMYFGAHCLTGESEVLTRTGWVPLTVWLGGEIAQWSPGGAVEFLPATSNKFQVEETLLVADAPYFRGRFTLGHTMPCTRHETRAHFTCKAGEFDQIGATSCRNVPVSGNLTLKGSLSPDELAVLAAVQADGHWEKSGDLAFCFRKTRKIERLEKLFLSLGIQYSKYLPPSKKSVGEFHIRVGRAKLPAWLSSDRKMFGPWLLDSTPEARINFLEEVLFWDGYRKTRSYYSTIRENAEWVVTIAHLCGKSAAWHLKLDGRDGRQPLYVVHIRESGITEAHTRHLKRKFFSGEVFCPTTKTGFFLFRNSGRIAVTGNTGRWSGAGGINFQAFRKVPLFCDRDLFLITDSAKQKEIEKHYSAQEDAGVPLAERTPPDFVAHVLDIRRLIIPRRGCKLISSDLSQIEPRTEAWLVGDTEMLASMAAGKSPYQAHAETYMGWPAGVDLKKSDKDLYALAKARILGLGFQCGWKKFITVAMNMAGLDITKNDPKEVPKLDEDGNPMFKLDGTPMTESGYGFNSKKTVKEYRESNPLIAGNDEANPGIWKRLDELLRASVGGDFKMTLPSGRELRYPEVKRMMRMAQDEETGKMRRKWETTALVFDPKRNGVVRKPFYGGILTENLVQATARDIFAEHLLALDSTPGIEVLFSVHDEAVCEVAEHITKGDVESIMGRTPEWIAGCPIAAEAVELPFYTK